MEGNPTLDRRPRLIRRTSCEKDDQGRNGDHHDQNGKSLHALNGSFDVLSRLAASSLSERPTQQG
jgi:hypothetical protein